MTRATAALFVITMVLGSTVQGWAGELSCATSSRASVSTHALLARAPALACPVDKTRLSRRVDEASRNYSPAQACMASGSQDFKFASMVE